MQNAGISFGWFPNISWIFILVVIVFLIVYAVKMRELFTRIGIFFIVVGGIGNLVSRVRYGAVVDNLNFLGIFYNNIWDWIIGIGVVICLVQYIYGNTRRI